MKKQILLFLSAWFVLTTVICQTKPLPRYTSINTHEFQYSKNKRIKTNYLNSDGDILFYSENKVFHSPYSQHDIQFSGFNQQVLFAKETDSSGYLVVNKANPGFKIYTLQYRQDSFRLDSILPDSQGTLRMYFVSRNMPDRSLFIGSFLQKYASFWTVNVLFESTANMATRASDEVQIFSPDKLRSLKNECDHCSNGFYIFYAKSFKTTDKKGYRNATEKFR